MLPSICHSLNKTSEAILLFPLQHRLKSKNFMVKHHMNSFVKNQRSIKCESSTHTRTDYVLAKNECGSSSVIELPGGKMVVELMAAWNNLADRMNPISSK